MARKIPVSFVMCITLIIGHPMAYKGGAVKIKVYGFTGHHVY